MSVNVGLMLFNLLPLYPLDGEKVLVGILPPRLGDGLLRLRPFEPLVLAGLLFVLPLVGFDLIWTIIGPVNSFLYRLLLFTR
jgi:Zn-dependent protease